MMIIGSNITPLPKTKYEKKTRVLTDCVKTKHYALILKMMKMLS